MLLLDTMTHGNATREIRRAESALMRSLDLGSMWRACSRLVSLALPVHSCSLMFDIDGYEPNQAKHYLVDTCEATGVPVNSLAVSKPYLIANPQVRWYTLSQIVSQDALAGERLLAQDPDPAWKEFIHLAFWRESRLEAVLSIRVQRSVSSLSEAELLFVTNLYAALDAGLHRVHALEAERLQYKALETLMYKLPLAALLVDRHALPLYMTAEARKLLEDWDRSLAPTARGRLPDGIRDALQALVRRQLLPGADHAAGRQPADVVLPHPRDPGARIKLSVGQPLLSSSRCCFVVTLERLGAVNARLAMSSPAALHALHKLSPGERKVAALVVEGLRNEAIAQLLCRSRKTIESQLSSIYRKLDVNTRTQLARLFS